MVTDNPPARSELERSGAETPGFLGRLRKIDCGLLLCVIAFWVVVLAIHRFYVFNIGPDAISYFSIAKVWFEGHGALALNTHWAPLFSWLLVPFFAVGIAPEVGGALLTLPLGAVILAASWRLGELLGVSVKWRRIAMVCMLPNLLFWAMVNCGADFLSLALMLVFFNLLLRPDFAGNFKLSASVGVLGGISYLAKSYCFPYFLASFTLISLWSALVSGGKWKRVCGCYVLGVSLFLAISVPWVIAISQQHQKLTIGTAGAFTLQFKAPNAGELSPTEDQGFVPPPSDYAVSYWESPGKLPTPGWSPLNSKSDFAFYVRVVFNNFFDAIEAIHGFSVLIVGLVAVAAMIELSRTLDHRPRSINPTLGLILLLAVYASGYILIFIAERYLWSVSLGGILIGCLAIQRIEEKGFVNRYALAAFILVCIGSCYFRPAALLARLVNFGKQYHTLSLGLDEIRGCRVVSNEFLPGLKLAYYQKAKFYGMPRPSMEPEAVAASLKENRIDFFFLWGDEEKPAYLNGWERVKQLPGVQLFRPPRD